MMNRRMKSNLEQFSNDYEVRHNLNILKFVNAPCNDSNTSVAVQCEETRSVHHMSDDLWNIAKLCRTADGFIDSSGMR